MRYPLEHFVYSSIILFWRIFSSFKKSRHNLLDSEQLASDLKFTCSKIFFAKCGNRRITSSMIAFLLQVITNNKFPSVRNLFSTFQKNSRVFKFFCFDSIWRTEMRGFVSLIWFLAPVSLLQKWRGTLKTVAFSQSVWVTELLFLVIFCLKYYIWFRIDF